MEKTTFLTVQRILDRRNRKGDRDIAHFHYLKGMLACGACSAEVRASRLIYSQNVGNGGTYEYYLCAVKQRGKCSLGAIRMDDIEAAVAQTVRLEGLHSAAAETVRQELSTPMASLQAAHRELKENLRQHLIKLEAQEERLIDLAADGTMPSDKLRERLNDIRLQKGAIKERLARTETHLGSGAEKVLAYIDLLESPGDLYASISPNIRRDVLSAFYERLVVHVEDDAIRLQPISTEVNDAIHAWSSAAEATNERASHVPAEGSPLSTTKRDNLSIGLSNS